MQKTISELNLESQSISEKWDAELRLIHTIFKRQLTNSNKDSNIEDLNSDNMGEEDDEDVTGNDMLSDQEIMDWLNSGDKPQYNRMSEFQTNIGSCSVQDLQLLNRVDSNSSIENMKVISCQNFMLSSYSKKSYKNKYLVFSQRQANILKNFRAKTIIMHHSLCQIYTYADELLKLEMDPAHFGSIYNRPRAWMRMCDDFQWDGLRQFILKAIFQEYQTLMQDKTNTQVQYKAYTVLRVMFVAFTMPLEQLIIYVIETCLDVKLLSQDQTKVYQFLQMINKDAIQKYSNQFVKTVIGRINNIQITHTSQELAAINFLALAKINKHLCLDLNTLGQDNSIQVNKLLINTEHQMFKLMRWTKLPNESRIWISGKKALVYDHVGGGKDLEIPKHLEVYCQHGKTQHVRNMPVTLYSPESLVSISLSQCPCPDMSKCLNVRNIAIFWVHNINTHDLEAMTKMEVCYFGDVRLKDQQKDVPIGDSLVELVQRWHNLRLCRIWFCPMSKKVVLHGPSPNLEILDIADCDGLKGVVLDCTPEVDNVFSRLEALQVDIADFETLEVVGSVKMPALVCLQGFSLETMYLLRKGIIQDVGSDGIKKSQKFKIQNKPYKQYQEARISEIKIGLNRQSQNNVGRLYSGKM